MLCSQIFMHHCRHKLNQFQSLLLDSMNPIHIDVYFILLQQFLHCSSQCTLFIHEIHLLAEKLTDGKTWQTTQCLFQTNVKKEAKPKKCPRRASNVMCASHNAWPVCHDAHEKRPGVSPGPSACLPTKWSRKTPTKMNHCQSGSCSSCRTKMIISSEQATIQHLVNGHGNT